MKNTENIRITIAESSLIIRSGVVAVLKRIPNLHVQTVEVTSLDGLENCLHTYMPDILLINPTFGGWFNVEEFKANPLYASIMCIDLNCNITNNITLHVKGSPYRRSVYNKAVSFKTTRCTSES